ncbi:disks large-associated protein 5 isoform X1 [Bufo bufo]|uniref:disks large-associated protein 5 isoform X1 n=1 Tax=Bufo bufo TaxID=8384 RepID=UPI001ABE69D2|nr:disks large-associated protein 5 isoform X1 [Bufo bufo]XP_040267500.1 disks large-associated protein 5 isoform X1 [Bufo bufo]
MDVDSQFVGRYKKDLSIENLRAKVARRKSITQKENRHKEFRKSRGLSLADVNVSLVKEQELTVVEEGNESCLKGQENNPGKTREQIIKEERHAMLQRFKEEKQLRKLKEQREKVSKGIFRCGIYKPEGSLIPVFTSQTAAKVKPKEKPPAPSVPRVTRSTLKVDPPANKTRTQVNVLTNKAPVDRAVPRGRGQTSVVKKNESKVSGISSARTTRSTAVKAPLKNPPAVKPQKKPLREISPEMVMDKTEPPVSDHSNERVQEPEPVLKDTHVESETLPETSPDKPERKPSFAPKNFVFQPLDGLSTFHFQPMTPNRANAFLLPTFTWSPLDGNRAFVVTREHKEHEEDLQSPTEPSQTATEVKLEVDLNALPQDAECASDANSSPQTSPAVTPPPCEPSTEDNKTTQPEEAPHDVPYFSFYRRSILKSEIQRLTLLCIDWDKRIDMDIPEDAKDLIRTTVGQTRLLMTERFKQFEGLVDNCEFKRGEKETTCTDLDGFWDMVNFQIEDLSKKFFNLVKLEENSWQQDTSQTKKIVRKKIAPAVTRKQNQGDDGRAAARGRLAAIRAAMKNRIKMEAPCAEVEVPVDPMQVDPIVFDAGFFRIESPAKLPGSLRTIKSSSRLNTPNSTNTTVQNLEMPVPNGIENAADLQHEKSPSPVRSPVRKTLFGGPEEESLQNQEPDPVLQSLQHTEADSIPAEVDLTMYLAPAQTLDLGAEESPGLVKCLGLDASETLDGCDAEANNETSLRVDDVFMCSPEKVEPETEASCLAETSEPGPDDEVKTTSNPLDFLGSCTPIMVKHAPMMMESTQVLTDLMTFSPMEL